MCTTENIPDDKREKLDDKKEGFIDLLLVVIGLVLAGSSNKDTLFYYAVFGFLTFAIATRAWMTFNNDKDKELYKATYIFSSLIMSVSFPLILVSYFHTVMFEGVHLPILLIAFAAITACISAFIFMSLNVNLEEETDSSKFGYLAICIELIFFTDLIILGICHYL